MTTQMAKIWSKFFEFFVFLLDNAPCQEAINKKLLTLEGNRLFQRRPFGDFLIEILYKRQCYEQVAKVYKRQQAGTKLYTSNLIKSLVKTDDVASLNVELQKFLSENSLARSKRFHVYETAMASVNYPNESRTELRNERIISLTVSRDEQGSWQEILINNGYLWKIEELEADGLLTERTVSRLIDLTEFQGDLLPYSKLAGLNNCMTLPAKTVVKGDRHIRYEALGEESLVELNIPATFFSVQNDENTRSVRRHLIDFYTHVIRDFVQNEVPFLPILQFGWNVSAFDDNNYVFSHHTKGGSSRHFHIKTAAVKGFVSLDIDGFAGWSSISKESEYYRERIGEVSISLAKESWKKVYNDIVVKNSSKYAQPDPERSGYTFKYIFVPLQIAVDQVASLSYISGHDLACFLVDKFRESGYKIVIKRHPLCRSNETKELMGELGEEDHVIISDGSVHELIRNASLIATVNSGVGMEAILHLKNVVITGKADYFFGATLVRTMDELERYLDSNDWTRRNDTELKKFVHFYFRDFLIDAGSGAQVSARMRAIGL